MSDKLVQVNRSKLTMVTRMERLRSYYCPDYASSPTPPPSCGRSLVCFCSDKALMESNMRTVLTPVSLIYQDYWHLQKQVVCLDEMFPRQKEKKKSGLIILALGTSPHWFFSAGQKQWELLLQSSCTSRCSRHVSPPAPTTSSSTCVSLHRECVNKPMILTSLTLLTPWPSSLHSPHQAAF